MRKLVKVVMGLTIVLVLSTGVCSAEWLICTPNQVGVSGDRVQIQITGCKRGDDPAPEWNKKYLYFKRGKENQMLATTLTAITLQSELSIDASPMVTGQYSEISSILLRNN